MISRSTLTLLLSSALAVHSMTIVAARGGGVSMTAAAGVSVEETVSIFGRLADSEHVSARSLPFDGFR
jgi:hypothetical protein